MTLVRGATLRLDMTLTDSAGDPRDLTGASAECAFRRQSAAGEEIGRLTSGDEGGITLDSETGRIIAIAQTADWLPGKIVFDLHLTESNGNILVLVLGELELLASATVPADE
ncbi:MAG TPA: hypothetical protein PLP58_17290 [Prosthecobacter sp.]|nr:hypothetical protein [Prosthecobacter sp.]